MNVRGRLMALFLLRGGEIENQYKNDIYKGDTVDQMKSFNPGRDDLTPGPAPGSGEWEVESQGSGRFSDSRFGRAAGLPVVSRPRMTLKL